MFRCSLSSSVRPVALLALLTLVLACFSSMAFGEGSSADQGRVIESPGAVLEQRDRPAVINRMLEDRLQNLLPALMRETGIDMWLVINREYAEDPVFFTLAPAPVHAARRTTMLVFFDPGAGKDIERLTVSRYPFGKMYQPAWEGGDLEAQWQRLGELIAEKSPKKIGINASRHWPVADGLTAALRDRLFEVLTPELEARVVSAENLAVRWLETRTALELETYPHIVGLARGVISEAFSNRVITPGATTVGDVAWYIAERFAELQLPIWFQPSVDVQRADAECESEQAFCGLSAADTVIRPGDVLHTDVGVCYLRLCTDTQEMAYVLRPGETEAPDELEEALRRGNRWQDILTSNMRTGRTGNQVLASTVEQCEDEQLFCSTYTHPIGYFGHAPGPTIGMWDNQGPTPVRGDWELYPSTAFSTEGNVRMPLDSWGGRPVQIMLEQDAVFDGDGVWYIAGRQTQWHLVR